MPGSEEAMHPTMTNDQATKDGKQERERSSIVFPYLDLESAIEIAQAVHAIGGSSCQWDQLAAKLDHAGNGGSFRLRVVTAKIFGLATAAAQTVSLTSLGVRIADPQQEKAARIDAFLRVPLYKAIYEQFKNGVLPPAAGLENAMVKHGVAAKQKDKARQVFQRSALQAGFFAYGNSKLVLPAVTGNNVNSSQAACHAPSDAAGENGSPRNDSGIVAASGGQRHPFIEGLLATLPEPHSVWSLDGRRKWLSSALSIFDLIFEGADDDQSISITVNKGSVK